MKVSNGLGLPVVALPGAGHMPEAEKDEARLFYVAATRATQKLVLGVGGVLGTSLLSDSFSGSAYYATANIPTRD